MTDMALAAELVRLPNTVMIGSQRLCVGTEESDIDLCVYIKELDDEHFYKLRPVKKQEYYDSLLMEHSVMLNLDDLDVFVFSSLEKLKVVELVMSIMEDYPKFVIRIKWVRVKIFRYLLRKYNFIEE